MKLRSMGYYLGGTSTTCKITGRVKIQIDKGTMKDDELQDGAGTPLDATSV